MVAESTSTTTQTTTTTTGTSVWAIDASHSMVEFGVKHLMVSTTKGRFTDITGTVTVDENDVTKSKVDVTIKVDSLSTFDEKRDGHLKSPDFFDVENYPTITFKSTKIEPRSSDRIDVTGDITIHGVTRQLTLQAEFNGRGTSPWGSEVVAYSAETSISRKDFGMGWNAALEAGGVVVGDKVKIALEIEAVKQ